jgi:hypothetical protein
MPLSLGGVDDLENLALACNSEAVEGLLIDHSSHFIDVNLNALTLQILA